MQAGQRKAEGEGRCIRSWVAQNWGLSPPPLPGELSRSGFLIHECGFAAFLFVRLLPSLGRRSLI